MVFFSVQKPPTNSNFTDFFATAYANGPFKTASIPISIISIFLILISGTGIIWFERFGSDKKRTLINRLLSSVCVTGIEFYLIPLPIEIIRHFYGPFGNVTCSVMLLFRTSLSLQVGLFTLGFSVSRYLYIFYLKNPARFQDEFWHFFVNIWVVSFGLISQFVFVILPGRQPISFYLCSGQDPRAFGDDSSIKKNHFFNLILLFTIVIQVAVAVRFVFHRIKIEWNATYAHTDNFRKEIIVDIILSVGVCVMFLIYVFIVVKINSIDPSKIGDFPNYLLVFSLHFGYPWALAASVAIFFLAKNGVMRSALIEKLKEMICT
jgi:hypothetical protein